MAAVLMWVKTGPGWYGCLTCQVDMPVLERAWDR